jgi:competence protein ComEC
VWWLQQRAALPGGGWPLAALGMAAGILAALAWASRRRIAESADRPEGWRREPQWWRPGRIAGAALVLAAGALAGAGWAAHLAAGRLAQVLPEALEGCDLALTGVVAGLPCDFGDAVRFDFRIDDAGRAGLPGTVRLSWYRRGAAVPMPPLAPGQRLALTARLKRLHGSANPHGPDVEGRLFAAGVLATGYVRAGTVPRLLGEPSSDWRARLDRVRQSVRGRIAATLGDDPHAGVVTALVVGVQAGISPVQWRLFSATGTGHLVAISGLHISLVAGLAACAARGVWRRATLLGRPAPLLLSVQTVGALALALAAAAFAALAGFGVPARRALCMTLVWCVSACLRRPVDGSVTLAWALGMVLATDPWALTAPGFWLSFAAVAALFLHGAGAPRRAGGDAHGSERGPASVRWRRCGAMVRRSALAQWAVTVALTPLTVHFFAQASVVAPLANALAIPWVSYLVVPAALAGAALPGWAGDWLLQAAAALLGCLSVWLDALARPAWSVWQAGAPQLPALLLSIAGAVWMLMPRGWPLRGAAPLLWLPLLVAGPARPATGEFRLTALDIGQGAALLVETAGHRLLFDTGPGDGQAAGRDAGARIIVPFLRAEAIARLDMLMVSHRDLDHAGGAASVLAALPVARLRASLPDAHPLWARARASGGAAAPCVAGEHWEWDGVRFDVLWPQTAQTAQTTRMAGAASNAASCVLRVSNGRYRALLTGDIGAPQEAALVARHGAQLDVDIVIAPHHGSRGSSSPAFVAATAPAHVVFQAGYRNRFGHPHPVVAARWRAAGAVLHRTDCAGAVRFETRGAALLAHDYRASAQRYWHTRCGPPAARRAGTEPS